MSPQDDEYDALLEAALGDGDGSDLWQVGRACGYAEVARILRNRAEVARLRDRAFSPEELAATLETWMHEDLARVRQSIEDRDGRGAARLREKVDGAA